MSCIREGLVRRWCVAAAGVAVLTATAVAAGGDPQPLIADSISALESALSEAAAGFDMGGSATYAKRLNAIADKHPAVVSLLLANAQGKVLAEVAREGQPGKAGRGVSGQAWFQAAGVKRTKHYGNLQAAKGPVTLFWAMPVGPGPKPGGALAAKVDVVQLLGTAAKAGSVPYAVVAAGKTLYSHNWSDGMQADERQLALPGLDGAALRVDAGALAKAVDTAKSVAAEPPAAAPASGVALPGAAISDAEAKKLIRVWLPILAAVIAFLVILLVVFLVQGRRGHRQEEIPVDFGDDASGVPPPPPPRQLPPTVHAPASLVVPPAVHSAPPKTGKAVLRPTERVTVPPEILAQGARPLHQANPQTRTVAGPAPVVTPELYEQLRQQITREVTEQIRAELRKETEAELRRTQAKAEVFYRTIQANVEELVRHLSEAEGRWTELNTAVKNCGFKLKQALDGLGQGKT